MTLVKGHDTLFSHGQRGSKELWSGYGLYVDCDLNLRDTTLGLGHDISLDPCLWIITSIKTQHDRSYDPDTDFGRVLWPWRYELVSRSNKPWVMDNNCEIFSRSNMTGVMARTRIVTLTLEIWHGQGHDTSLWHWPWAKVKQIIGSYGNNCVEYYPDPKWQ